MYERTMARQRMTERKRILILFSDTGGGHRSAAEAIAEAMEASYPERYTLRFVDALREYAPRPLSSAPVLYPEVVRFPRAWELGYRIFDGHLRAKALTIAFWPYVRSAAHRLVREQPADLILSVHPLMNGPVLRALGRDRPPFLTVITDLVTTHALWFDAGVDLCLVPTEAARAKAFAHGLSSEQVRVVGLPVARRFCGPLGDRVALRKRLGWPTDLPVVLLMGGGEGMGPLMETARAIASGGQRLALAVVAGRNRSLRVRLEKVSWEIPTRIYGFERRLPEMMQAATLLVSKAGPGTICEAMNAGLPIVLNGRLPGQEDGNVRFVVEEEVGVWAPGPQMAAQAVQGLIANADAMERMARACRRVARPRAALEIAETIDSVLQARPANKNTRISYDRGGRRFRDEGSSEVRDDVAIQVHHSCAEERQEDDYGQPDQQN